MADYSFSAHERYAVWTTHGEKCYICAKPVDLSSMQVDHIVPEHLDKAPANRAEVLASLGLPSGFDLNSFENWLPACGPCNRKKGGQPFRLTPLVQIELDKAARHAGRARKVAGESVSSRKLSRALNTLERAISDGNFDRDAVARIGEMAAEAERHRLDVLQGTPMHLAPVLTLLAQGERVSVFRGRYGVGAGPNVPGRHAVCGVCGLAAWNGARCVACGAMSD